MSDPLDRLRGADASSSAPDVEAIKARARRIEVRRRTALGAGAAALVLVAAVGVLVVRQPGEGSRRLAQPPATAAELRAETPPAAEPEGEMAAVGEPGPAASVRAERSAAGTAASTAAADEAGELEATLEVRDGPEPRRVDLVLEVCNRTDRAVTRTYGDAQRYDFEVSRGGELVWRWSDGMAFAQVVGEEEWGPGKCKTWTESWDGMDGSGTPVPTGTYEAVGVLTASPPLRTGAESFCLDVC